MRELKPKLIIADSGRRRRGVGGGFWSFLTFLIVFAVGVYVGTKLDEYGFTNGGNKANTGMVQERDAAGENGESKAINSGGGSVYPKDPAVVISEKLEYDKEVLTDPTVSESVRGGTDAGITSLDPEGITGPGVGDGDGSGEAADSTEEDGDDAAEETGSYRYTLQIAAFATPEDAQKAVNDYRSKGYNAYTVQVENSRGEKWNLVKIGKYRRIEQAWNQSALFKRREGKDAYVETLSQDTVFNESWDKNENAGQ